MRIIDKAQFPFCSGDAAAGPIIQIRMAFSVENAKAYTCSTGLPVADSDNESAIPPFDGPASFGFLRNVNYDLISLRAFQYLGGLRSQVSLCFSQRWTW